MPRVSVVVPNYNHARFLRRRIESILEQTYRDYELILLDDASADGSVRIIEQYRRDPRVTIVLNDRNSGSPFPQWNLGVRLARGEYVWMAEADDDAEPELLANLAAVLEGNPSAVLAYCQSWVIDENGRRVETKLSWTHDLDENRWMNDFINDGPDEASRYLVVKNTIPNASAVLFRRKDYLAVGGAPTNMRLCGDWMVWAELAARGKLAFVSRPLNLFREHPGTVRSSSVKLNELHETFDVVARIQSLCGIEEGIGRRVAARIVSQWQSEYWCNLHPIALIAIFRVSASLWRMNRVAGSKFLLFFLLRKAVGTRSLMQFRALWRRFKRSRAVDPA